MADGHGAAVDVRPVPEAVRAVDVARSEGEGRHERHCGEGLVDLDHVDVVEHEARVLERELGCDRGHRGDVLGISGGCGGTDDARERLAPVDGCAREHEHRGPRAQVGCVPGGDAVASVDGLQGPEALDRRRGPRDLVMVELDEAPTGVAERDGRELVGEEALRERGGVAGLAAQRPLVLLLSVDAEPCRLDRGLHGSRDTGPRARHDELVGQGHVAESLAEPSGLEEVRDAAEVLHPAGHGRRGVARAERLAREVDGHHRRAARAIHRVRDAVVGDLGAQLHLARDGALASREVHADGDLVDLGGFHTGACERGTDGVRPKLREGQRRERPAELAEWRAGHPDDVHVLGGHRVSHFEEGASASPAATVADEQGAVGRSGISARIEFSPWQTQIGRPTGTPATGSKGR